MIAAAIALHLAGGDDPLIDGLTFDLDAASNTFIEYMPDAPDVAVAVMSSGALPQLSKAATDLPTVQVIVRHRDPVAGYTLARAIYDALACLPFGTLAEGSEHEVLVIGCTPAQSGPISIGRDDNQRHEWSLNFQLRVHAPTTHRP